MLPKIAFCILSVLTLTSAILVITRRNAVHSVIALIVTLFSVGGIFLMLEAQFLFAVQIILYVGGIMVLFLFVVMLVNLEVVVRQQQFSRQWTLALFTAFLLAVELGYGLYYATHQSAEGGFSLPQVAAGPVTLKNTEAVGTALYQNYMLPVEIASLLLLVAMVGAVIMAKRKLE